MPTPETTPATPTPYLRASRRVDGWSGERQAAFLEHLADGICVDTACRMVGLSPASAYAFRRRAPGAAFALGWRAACLVARDKVADDLMLRATQGQTVTTVRADGSEVTRHLYDNRLALALLTRLDRQAEDAPGGDANAARLVASEFDAFLDLIEQGDSAPARAGLFLARRMSGAAEGDARDLGPVLALAAADRFARTGAATAGEVAIADLDPAARADWSAEQWQRAEAAGLLALAPAAPPPPDPEHSQHSAEDDCARPGIAARGRVWWDEIAERWATDFPPPADYDGEEEGAYGDADYARELSDDEADVMDASDRADIAEQRAIEEIERDDWFATLAAAAAAQELAAQAAVPETLCSAEAASLGGSGPGGSGLPH